MNRVSLERIDIDDVATNVERIVAEIHRQLGDIEPPVPVHDIARALDIEEIRETSTTNFEAMLITGIARDTGAICVNRASNWQRRRYSVAHELGHFLCGWHTLNSDDGFRCSKQDMAVPLGNRLHITQETEANQFAIELLAPERMVSRHLRSLPELEQVVAMHTRLDISKTAAARRYVKLHKEPLGVVFATNGIFQYADRGPDFPYIDIKKGQPLPSISGAENNEAISEMAEADALDWGLRNAVGLSAQTFRQEGGHQIVLLHLDAASSDRA